MNKIKTKHILMAIVAFLIIIGLFDKFASQAKTLDINGTKFQVEIADTPTKLVEGLSNRESLATNEGMLFLFDDRDFRSFWMKDMNFAIDLLWIDGNLIVGWEENMQPQPDTADERLKKYRSLQPVDKVLELPAGSIQKLNIQRGQRINLEYYES